MIYTGNKSSKYCEITHVELTMQCSFTDQKFILFEKVEIKG